MAVAQPQILFIMDETSGTTVTNYGSVASNGTVAQGVENTNWDWNAGPPTYWEAITPHQGAAMPYMSLTGIALPTTATQSVWAAIHVRLASFDTVVGQGILLASNVADGINQGLPAIYAIAPAGGGNFDLFCAINNGSALAADHTFTGLSFGVDYPVVLTLDATDTAAAIPRFKLGANAVVTLSTVNVQATAAYANNGGWLGRGNDFSNYGGLTGRIQYAARGCGVALSATDMADINTSPSTTIGGWPSSIVVATQLPTLRRFGRRRQRYAV